ncbi:MAG TPA: TlpA disulfide reductase family protein [Bryobacteraceae bacterium]|nr:TlpA disulfide reductase family protein [Bryobacteraceae bacterium]
MRLFFCLVACAATLMAGDLSGRRAPGFSLIDVNLTQHDLQDYRGKIVLVDFIQTTCPHCGEFSKTLQEVVARYSGKVAVLSIVNPPDTPATVKPFIAQHKLSYPLLFDCGQVAASYVKAASFDVPHLFIIDAQGTIQNDYGYNPFTRGIFEGRDLFSELDRMLKSK